MGIAGDIGRVVSSDWIIANCDEKKGGSRAGLSLKWLKMVFIPLLGFGGSFEAHALPAFTTMP
jgi:hypothetical protein